MLDETGKDFRAKASVAMCLAESLKLTELRGVDRSGPEVIKLSSCSAQLSKKF